MHFKNRMLLKLPRKQADPISHHKSAIRLFLEWRFAHLLCGAQEMSMAFGLMVANSWKVGFWRLRNV